jgi:hypothetical protein
MLERKRRKRVLKEERGRKQGRVTEPVTRR